MKIAPKWFEDPAILPIGQFDVNSDSPIPLREMVSSLVYQMASRIRETERWAVYGAGGLAREITPLIAGDIVHVSDQQDECGSVLNGRSIISFDDLRGDQHCDRLIVIAIGDADVRCLISTRCASAGLSFGRIIAPNQTTYDRVVVGDGSIIMPHSIVTSDVSIGSHVIIHYLCHISHDCSISNHVTFGPRSGCCGNVIVEERVFVGAGATIAPGRRGRPLTIGAGSKIGAGAVVVHDVEPGTTVVGVPARLLERRL